MDISIMSNSKPQPLTAEQLAKQRTELLKQQQLVEQIRMDQSS